MGLHSGGLRELATSFLHDYCDPEIDKRLYFDAWADRTGLRAQDKARVWAEVKRITRQRAGRKARVTREHQLHGPSRHALG